ncbi:hypothetical protein [Thiomicrorhabdus sp. 6S3-12]|uniref:hypothetical protein n=1 Tax=Thiomicrorhabdus sp. 6S3-12 TaxID=2819681 RepID=UPI001AADADD8|nr:hypothetical protein [Thiomicrorhabdus sp. 6S3-12]MBO1924348.1 hypothetical protein [Thiomicrorhabdus sp. 6S3-12]
MNKSALLLASCLLFSPVIAQADWWQDTKEAASDAWTTSKEKVSEWTQDAKESETMQSVKEGAKGVVDTVSDKQTYVNAWESTKEAASGAADTVTDAFHKVHEENVHDEIGPEK